MEPISIDVHVVATVYKSKCIVDAFISQRHSINFFKRRNFEDVRRRLQIDQNTQDGAPGQMHVYAKRTSKAI